MVHGGRPDNRPGGKRQGPKRIGCTKPPPGRQAAGAPPKNRLTTKKQKKAAATAAAWALLEEPAKGKGKGKAGGPKRFQGASKPAFAF